MAAARCVFCNQPVHSTRIGPDGSLVCLNCRGHSSIVLLPALLENQVKPSPPPDPPAEGEAACFYSPNRRATRECSHCGVLISDVWAAQWGSKDLCLKCLEHLRAAGRDGKFEGSRTLWDNIALVLALIVFVPIANFMIFFTAPIALFLALWHWNSPRSLVPRSRLRIISALLLSLLQVGGGITLIIMLYFRQFD